MNKKWIVTASFIFLCGFGSMNVNASEWREISREPNGIVVYLDMESVQKVNGHTKTVWTKHEEKDKTVQKLEAFTVEGKYKVLDMVTTANGINIESPVDEDWKNVVPDTVAGRVYRRIWNRSERRRDNDHYWEGKRKSIIRQNVDRAVNRITRDIWY